MNTVHRQIGRLKGKADNTKVSVILNEYESANKALKQTVEAANAWRDAWVNILNYQSAIAITMQEMYEPIVGTSDEHRDYPAATPQDQMERAVRLKDAFAELKAELSEEIIMIDARVIKPATDAIEGLGSMRKVIKKRENKRLDWERQIDKVNNGQRKTKRTDKDNIALAKAELELAILADEFKYQDNHLRETLPPLVAAAFSLFPHLMAVQIMIQHSLLAQYYTTLHNYSEDVSLPSPAPPMDVVISKWDSDFRPAQKALEGITCVARGRAVHGPMASSPYLSADEGSKSRSHSTSGLAIRGIPSSRRPPTSPLPPSASPQPNFAEEARKAKMRIPSSNSIPVMSPPSPAPTPSPEPRSDYLPSYTPSISAAHTPAFSPAGPTSDYFQRTSSSPSVSVIGKKKPPPPPPPKRAANTQPTLFAVAMYGFEGQSDGDLSFREGDRIRIVKKTGSVDDWWEGELGGRIGSFPANYCRIG